MNDKLLCKKDIGYDNLNFWYYYIMGFRGFDEEKELNMDDAIREVINFDQYVPDFKTWYNNFLPEDDADKEGYFENPKEIAGRLTDEMGFAIEFHLSETIYYLNNYYIGNLGGHFEAWFLTLDELLAFDKYDFLFLLLLPMAGIEETEKEYAVSLISERLKKISMFAGQSDYIAGCIANGLVIEGKFYDEPQVGVACHTNHSVRNVLKYPRYKDDVIELNKSLKAFVDKVVSK
ncbi:Imm19 family immunity protein [Prevotella sp. 10(H)]|uniref:Imm19 family immunity protein n=1 Tax=Prevotella sp. 10(H) TaxID=1158294 RepID=UPI0004A6DB38|nr:Imm19 family immunity protein [Prevotella sp. 10(H)]